MPSSRQIDERARLRPLDAINRLGTTDQGVRSWVEAGFAPTLPVK